MLEILDGLDACTFSATCPAKEAHSSLIAQVSQEYISFGAVYIPQCDVAEINR